jgi:hypothetical protein
MRSTVLMGYDFNPLAQGVSSCAMWTFTEFLKNRRSMITIDRPDDYEWAQQQALMFLDAPPFMLDGRYGSRDSLYNGD